MRMRWLLLGVMAGCGDGGGDPPPADGAPVDTPVVCIPDPGPATVIYVNRVGGTYTKGSADDSSANVSSIITANVTLGAAIIDDADWTEMRACLDDRFARFNVMITEADPGATEHQEVAVIDSATQLGFPAGLRAVAPAPQCAGGGAPVPGLTGISFVMWGAFPAASNVDRCEAIAQTIAVTYGLDHSVSCPDLTSFLSGCGAKSFTDASVRCGETEARPCQCGGTTQNSFRYLTDLLGARCPN